MVLYGLLKKNLVKFQLLGGLTLIKLMKGVRILKSHLKIGNTDSIQLCIRRNGVC